MWSRPDGMSIVLDHRISTRVACVFGMKMALHFPALSVTISGVWEGTASAKDVWAASGSGGSSL